jgi:hypothetical protein
MTTAKAICIKDYIGESIDGEYIEIYNKGRTYTVVVKYYDKRYFKIIKDEKTN